MKLRTKYFGEIDYEKDELITFPKGLFGFEDEHAFLLIPFQADNHTLFCLQSAQTSSLAFVLMDPFSLSPSYAPMPQSYADERDVFKPFVFLLDLVREPHERTAHAVRVHDHRLHMLPPDPTKKVLRRAARPNYPHIQNRGVLSASRCRS